MRNCEDNAPNIDWCITHNLTTDSLTLPIGLMPIGEEEARFTTSSECSTIDNIDEYKSSALHVNISSFGAFLVEG